MLAGSLAFVKAEVGVLDRGHFDIGILVKRPGSSIMAVEYLSDRFAAPAVGDPDFGADAVIMDRRFDQFLRARRTVDVDRLGALAIPRQ